MKIFPEASIDAQKSVFHVILEREREEFFLRSEPDTDSVFSQLTPHRTFIIVGKHVCQRDTFCGKQDFFVFFGTDANFRVIIKRK